MPKKTSIGLSNETLELVKDFKEDINAKSLEQAVKLSIGWAKSFNSNLLVSQVELAEKIEKIEKNENSRVVLLANILSIVLATEKRVKKLEEEKENE